MFINGVEVKALVDTGCEQSVILGPLCHRLHCRVIGPDVVISMLNGEATRSNGEVVCDLRVQGCELSNMR